MTKSPPTTESAVEPAIDLLFFERRWWARGVTDVAGVDEAGRGPLAGPVVAAAVVFPPELRIPDVRDSKLLSPARREALFGTIRSAAAGVGVGIVDHELIDRLNILQATILAMKEAIAGLPRLPGQLLVDGNFFSHEAIPVENIVRGDRLSHAIAAASIIAKVTRDRIMLDYDRRYPQYGFAQHKGYGTAAHIAAIHRFGRCPIHRRSFSIAGVDGDV